MKNKKRAIYLLLALLMLPVPIPVTTQAADDPVPIQDNMKDYQPNNPTQYIAPYDNSPIAESLIIAPRVNYPVTDSDPGAVVSIAQLVSFNDVSKSYMRFKYDDIKDEPWAKSVSSAYTLVDWRYWDTAKTADVIDRMNIADEDNSINYSKLVADDDMTRAINILGEDAFIPENVRLDTKSNTYQSYIHDIDSSTVINKTEALSSLYKAVGNKHFQPPVILYNNLDGAAKSVTQTRLKDTTAASLPGASEFLYYDVKTKDARHLVYLSNNLIEGYLWDALQDGIISYKELRPTERSMIVDKYAKGVYATPISSMKAKAIPANWDDLADDVQHSIGYMVGKENGGSTIDTVTGRVESTSDIRLRYETPQAFYNESISFLDFCVLASRVMHLRGEQVLTDAEEKILVSSYSSKLPSLMGSEYYDAVMYLTARGIIDDSYIGDGLYEALTWKDCFVICSRIKDKDSRLTFKNVTVPFNLEMANEGYMEVEPAVSNMIPSSIEQIEATVTQDNQITLTGSYDRGVNYKGTTIKRILYIRKDDDTVFKDSNGKEVFPHISLSTENDAGEYGYCEPRYYYDNDNKAYYCINIYKNQAVPDCYSYYYYNKDNKRMQPKEDPRNQVKDFVLYAPDSSKRLVVQNINQDGENLYVYSTASRTCNYIPADASKIKKEIGKIEYMPTAEINPDQTGNEEIQEQQAGEKAIYKIVLPANAKIAAYGEVEESKFEKITSTDKIPKDKWDDGKVYCLADNDSTTLWVIATKTDQVEAAIQANIRYETASNSNSVAYVRRTDQKDVYYGSNFLSSQLNIRVFENNDEKEFRITSPTQEFKVKYDKSSGWIVFGSNQILCFSTSVPPIKKNTNEGSSEAYFVHGLVVDFYMRREGDSKRAWSSYLTADGVLNLGAEASTNGDWSLTSIDTKITGAWIGSPIAGGDASKATGHYMYRREKGANGAPEYYMDVQSIPPQFSNFVLIWDVASDTNINAYVVNIVPKGVASNYASQDESILNTYTKRAGVKLPKDSSYAFSYFQAQDFSNISSLTTLMQAGKFYKTPKFIYDPNTFTALWRQEKDLLNESQDNACSYGLGDLCLLDSTDGKLKAFGLPYVYNNDKVYFVNLPFMVGTEGNADKLKYRVMSDLSEAYSGSTTTLSNEIRNITNGDFRLYQLIYNPASKTKQEPVDTGEYDAGKATKGFPIFPLVRIFGKDSMTVFPNITASAIRSHNWTELYACPSAYYIKLDTGGQTTDGFQATSVSHYPKWAIDYWSPDATYTTSTKTVISNNMSGEGLVAVQVGSAAYIIEDFSLDIDNDTTTDDIPSTVTKLTAEVVDSLNSIVDMLYMSEKELDAKFEDANSILGLAYLVITVLLPRILFGLLFIVQILGLIANNRVVVVFCEKIFDFYKFLSFGRLTYDKVDVARLWLTGMFGSVCIILISRGYGLRTLTWFVSVILDTLKSIW